MVFIQPIPALELRHRDLKLARNAVHGVAAAHSVEHAAAGSRAFVAVATRARLDDQALSLHQRIGSPHVIEPRQRAHRDAVAARDAAQSLTRAYAIHDLTLAPTARI